jgi:hypothetical protein
MNGLKFFLRESFSGDDESQWLGYFESMNIGIATCADQPNMTPGDREFASHLEKKAARVAPLNFNKAFSKFASPVEAKQKSSPPSRTQKSFAKSLATLPYQPSRQ